MGNKKRHRDETRLRGEKWVCHFVVAAFLSGTVWAQGPSLAGCRLFPSDNVWNTPIDGAKLDPNSANYVATIGADKPVHADLSIPFIAVPGNQPKVPVTFTAYGDESDPGPYPIPANAPIEGGPASTGDRHVLVVDQGACKLYELFRGFPDGNGGWKAASGAIFDLNSNAFRPEGWTSTDAAGLAVLPGLARFDEVAAGEIRHALRFTVPQTRKAHVWPATHDASRLTGPDYPPMGERFRLRANFDDSAFSPQARVFVRALKKYGMILADNGSAWFISGAPDPGWNNEQLRDLAKIKGADFEAVDESSLMVNSHSGQTKSPTVRVLDAASQTEGPVSPGKIVSLYGEGIGPEIPSAFRVGEGNTIASELNGTRVLFDGIAAPLLYVSASQINLTVPFAVAGKTSTDIEVNYLRQVAARAAVPVLDASPGLFAAILNQDYSVNSAASPAAKNSVVMLYATGAGVMDPEVADGQIAGSNLSGIAGAVTVQMGAKPAQVLYAGSAPGAIAGLVQVNARVPLDSPSGNLPIALSIGGVESPPGSTIAVR